MSKESISVKVRKTQNLCSWWSLWEPPFLQNGINNAHVNFIVAQKKYHKQGGSKLRFSLLHFWILSEAKASEEPCSPWTASGCFWQSLVFLGLQVHDANLCFQYVTTASSLCISIFTCSIYLCSWVPFLFKSH